MGRAALFNLSTTVVDPTKQGVALGHNKAASGLIEANAQAAFTGRYAPKKVGLFKRLLLRILTKKPTDHVDPPATRAWARGLNLMRMNETP